MIQELTTSEAGFLADSGALPDLPQAVEAMGRRGAPRDPYAAEIDNVRWLAHFDGRKATGILAYRDVYDPHTSATVREVIHLAGSPRAVVVLARDGIDRAQRVGLPILATVDAANWPMRLALVKLGLVMERVTYAIGGTA